LAHPLTQIARQGTLAFHTLRHLRPRQLAHLAWTRLLAPHRTAAPRVHSTARRDPSFALAAPALPMHRCAIEPDDLAANRFTFLNRTEHLATPIRWNDPELPLLWRYNLHYFDYLWDAPPHQATRLLADWLRAHPRPSAPAWDPYPLSVRTMNWTLLLTTRLRPWLEQAPTDTRDALLGSLFTQGHHLRAHLERHLDGNHLFTNAAALALLGRFFDGPAAHAWRSTARRLLLTLAHEQFLPDGGHVERSPMYHALVLVNLLHAINADAAWARQTPLPDVAARAAAFLAQMTDRNGEVFLLNDSAHGIAPLTSRVLAYARNVLGRPIAHRPRHGASFLRTGYHLARNGDDLLLVDAAPVGPDHQPGHAHGDIFSFEFTVDGRPLVVDTGLCDYLSGPDRSYVRSTAAHNTIELDGQDQCEFWAAFRVARRGRPHDVEAHAGPGTLRLSGWHDGYLRLPGRPVHHRAMTWERRVLRITDSVRSGRTHDIASRLHLHPDATVERCGDREVLIANGPAAARLRLDGTARLSIEPAWHCPQFGIRIPTLAITIRARASAWSATATLTPVQAA